MFTALRLLWHCAVSVFNTRSALIAENLVLRQQLSVFRRLVKRPRLSWTDRLFWICLARYWARWRQMLYLVTPDTVVRWHREGFRYRWRWKSRRRVGRPTIAPEIRALIRRMSSANQLLGAPRIHGELLKLGIEVSQATVSKYMVRSRPPPSQTWRTFLKNHAKDLVAIDFFTVPMATFRILYVPLVFSHNRRHIVHLNVTEHPTSQWTAQQIVEAFPFDSAPRYLLRDRDQIYGVDYQCRVRSLNIAEVLTAPHSPWQSPYVERVIGSIRRDCLDHIIVFNALHLKRILRDYLAYYHSCRTQLSLNKDRPDSRPVESPELGHILESPRVGACIIVICESLPEALVGGYTDAPDPIFWKAQDAAPRASLLRGALSQRAQSSRFRQRPDHTAPGQ
jgi:putative transposase